MLIVILSLYVVFVYWGYELFKNQGLKRGLFLMSFAAISILAILASFGFEIYRVRKLAVNDNEPKKEEENPVKPEPTKQGVRKLEFID